MGYYQEIDIILNDIKELQEMVAGFRNEANLPEFIIRLAENKSEKIKSRLKTLKTEATQKEQQQEPVVPEIEKKQGSGPVIQFASPMDEEPAKQDEVDATQNDSQQIGSESEPIASSHVLMDSINERLSRPQSFYESIEKRLAVDVRKALSLNDRFRFQRELFNNDAKYMDKVLDEISTCANLSEVLGYLKEKFNWSKENEPAMDFIKIVIKKFS